MGSSQKKEMPSTSDNLKFSLVKYLTGHSRTKWSSDEHPTFSKYYSRITCKPNCNPKKGGPPIIITVLVITILIINGTYDQSFIQGFERYDNNTIAFIPKYRNEIWRYWTYQFSHANTMHLVNNLLLLTILGIPLEIVHSSLRIFM